MKAFQTDETKKGHSRNPSNQLKNVLNEIDDKNDYYDLMGENQIEELKEEENSENNCEGEPVDLAVSKKKIEKKNERLDSEEGIMLTLPNHF